MTMFNLHRFDHSCRLIKPWQVLGYQRFTEIRIAGTNLWWKLFHESTDHCGWGFPNKLDLFSIDCPGQIRETVVNFPQVTPWGWTIECPSPWTPAPPSGDHAKVQQSACLEKERLKTRLNGKPFQVELDVLDLLWREELPNSHYSPNGGQKLICRYHYTAQSCHLSSWS